MFNFIPRPWSGSKPTLGVKGRGHHEKALVAQGGGPTAVINQSLAGVVLEARRFSNIEAVYGACHGVAGISPENIVDLGQETTQQIELVAAMPGSALGSTRDKPDTKYCQEILRVLQAHGIKLLLLYRRQ